MLKIYNAGGQVAGVFLQIGAIDFVTMADYTRSRASLLGVL